MSEIGLRALCNALGFFAVVTRSGRLGDSSAARALKLARLAEEFCQIHATPSSVPAALTGDDDAEDDRFTLHRRMANAIAALIATGGECMPHDLEAVGFSIEDVRRGWPMAVGLAHAMTAETRKQKGQANA